MNGTKINAKSPWLLHTEKKNGDYLNHSFMCKTTDNIQIRDMIGKPAPWLPTHFIGKKFNIVLNVGR